MFRGDREMKLIDVLESIVKFLNVVGNVILVIFGVLLIVYICLQAFI